MRRRMAAVLSLGFLIACGGGSSPSGPSKTPTPAPTATPDPALAFGAGQHLLGSQIAAGRYFADPSTTGCYWERNSGLGGTLGEINANDVFIDDPMQVIVDVLTNDVAFTTDADCGSWYITARQPAQATIRSGLWLVNQQIAPGTYTAATGAGCYWERLRDFQGSLNGIIANDFIDAGGTFSVTIHAGDAGFSSDGDCGTWSLAAGGVERLSDDELEQSQASIKRAWEKHRARRGGR